MEEFEEYEEYEEFEEDEEGMERMDPDGEVEQDDGDSFTFAGEDDEDGEESWGGGAADDLGGIGMEEDAVREVEYTETPVVPASTESSPSADSTATAASSSSSSSKGTVAPTGSITTAILELVEFDEALGTSEWKLADVKANASTKGRKMSKRQLAQRIPILLASVVRARVYVDF
ncbi:MAG: hypothetical protein WDW38_010695 [Sanguina aurantia]